MSARRMKPVMAGTAVAGMFGLLVAGVAWGTPGVGIGTVIVSGPTPLGAIDVRSESGVNEVEIKTKGVSDLWVVHNTISPGGHTGWHSHPGPSIISVVSGTATEYHGDAPSTPVVHPAGTSFVDDGEHSHILRNEGAVDLVTVAVQFLPRGATRRIDRPAP